jgi:hypothetical protein
MTIYETPIDPLAFDSWVQVAALGIVVVGGLVAKYLNTLKKDTTNVLATLTQNNGGSTVKDQLDKIEKSLKDHIEWSEGYVKDTGERLDALERTGKRYAAD